MSDQELRAALVADFPELLEDQTILQKEVHAHFGLTFFYFSLLEASMINALTLHSNLLEVREGKIKSQSNWEDSYDRKYSHWKSQTFGNLKRNILEIKEFVALESDLKQVHRSRNYFAHHFYREEVSGYSTEEGCWTLLIEMRSLRQKLISLDQQVESCFKGMLETLGLPKFSDKDIKEGMARLQKQAQETAATTGHRVGWKD